MIKKVNRFLIARFDSLFTALYRFLVTRSDTVCVLLSSFYGFIRPTSYKEMLEQADDTVKLFSKNCVKTNDINKLRKMMVMYYITKYIHMHEFLVFDFFHLSKKQKKEYITRFEKRRLSRKYNGRYKGKLNILNDKAETADIFSEYYKREWLNVSSKNDFPQFNNFCNKKARIVVKPINEHSGRGVACVSIQHDNIEMLFGDLIKEYGKFICEEKIIQCDESNSWNPDSVNTLRLPTIRSSKGNITIFKPFFRTGRKGSFTDNAGQGGVFAGVDPNTGVITTDGYDTLCNKYIEHPDSNKKFLGYQIPRWIEAVELGKTLANVLPNQKYVGWDLALTDKGWLMIEANWGGLRAIQIVGKKGCRKEFMKLIKS